MPGNLHRPRTKPGVRTIRRAGANKTGTGAWVRALLERKPARLTTVAVANKTARIAWAVLTHGESYRPGALA